MNLSQQIQVWYFYLIIIKVIPYLPHNYKCFCEKNISDTYLIFFNPGYNLGDPAQFSYMFIQNTNKNKLLKMEQDYGEEYASQAKIGWGMSTGFAWNVAMAHYQGECF